MNETQQTASRAILIAQEQAKEIEKVITTVTGNYSSYMRDLLATCLAAIGGGLTILTVKPDFIKTPFLFIFALLLLGLACVLTFICRRSVYYYGQEVTAFVQKQRVQISDAAMVVIDHPEDLTALDQLRSELKQVQKSTLPTLAKVIDNGDVYIGIMALVGIIIAIIGLFFRISI